MKCEHVHKDAPEGSLCEDCLQKNKTTSNICECGHDKYFHINGTGGCMYPEVGIIDFSKCDCPCKKFVPVMNLESLKAFNQAVKDNFNVKPVQSPETKTFVSPIPSKGRQEEDERSHRLMKDKTRDNQSSKSTPDKMSGTNQPLRRMVKSAESGGHNQGIFDTAELECNIKKGYFCLNCIIKEECQHLKAEVEGAIMFICKKAKRKGYGGLSWEEVEELKKRLFG